MERAPERVAPDAARTPLDAYNPRTLRRSAPAGGRPLVTLRHPAWICFGAALALALLGVFCIDLTAGVGSSGASPLAIRQLLYLSVAVIGCAIAAAPHYKLIGAFSPILVLVTLGLLIFVLIPFVPEVIVTPRNGARRWINLGIVDFQPSELAKIVYVIAAARYLRFRKNHRRLLGLIPPAVITFVPMALILVEPDLGTALLFLPALFAMLIAAGAKLKHLILIVILAMGAAPAMYPLLQPHQKQRIEAIMYQLRDDRSKAESINYQGFRAMTLVGAGGVAGMGGEKSRAVIDYNELPEDHNDMIFAVIANRFGLVGGLATMGLYMLWLLGAVWTAAACKDPFGRLLVVGLAAIMVTQMTINVGMTIGVLPITGMTLPFVSYGGSSLVSAFLITGLIMNVAMRRPAWLQRQSFEFARETEEQ
jgi:cell division protein FtsW (lipid II flippase)